VTFRCSGCQAVVWLRESNEAHEAGGRCRSCGRWFELRSLRAGESGGQGLVVEARRLAFASGIDLPAAYSVALGIMTLDEVRSRLPRAGKEGGEGPASAAARRPIRGWSRLLLPLLVALACTLAWRIERAPGALRANAITERARVGSAEVVTDSQGRILQVSAPDPRSVLAAYCAAGRGQVGCEVVDVVPSPLRPSGSRIGLLRPSGETTGGILALTIDEDRSGERWVAGSGSAPLEPSTAPSWAEQAPNR
jgi:hypothetical protein